MPFCHSSTQLDALSDDLLLRIFGAVPVYDRCVRNLRMSTEFAPYYELCDSRHESQTFHAILTCARPPVTSHLNLCMVHACTAAYDRLVKVQGGVNS